MLESIINSTTLPLLEKLATFGERRQSVLAANTANFDTPGYKMRDLPVAEFQKALREAVEFRGKPAALNGALTESAPPEAGAVEKFFPAELFVPADDQAREITFHDANNRSVEYVQMEMMKNLLMQNFAIEMMHAQMNMLESVITERNNV